MVLDPSGSIGRYAILRVLGAGGVGIVYLAHDTALARRVALKLLSSGADDPERDRLRITREAHALARLCNPNVVTIYDVGAHDGHLYLAMEFIEGGTLRQWLEQRRTTDGVIEVVTAAGRGLAAAHAAGLVHRDFKLDNVLVARDGRVVVTDFGLATPVADAMDAGDDSRPWQALAASAEPLEANAVAGTPGYVAPETYLGAIPDPRADQFSFGVTLYRCLYGRLPYPRRRTWRDAPPASAPRLGMHGRIPRRVRRALLRALAIDPVRRFADVPALLAALAPRRHSRRVLAIAAGVAALAIVGVLVAWPRSAPVTSSCGLGGERLAHAFRPEVAVRMARAFTATATPYAAITVANVRTRLETYGGLWRTAFLDTCRAGDAGVHAADVIELRTECLETQARQFSTLVDAFVAADPAVVMTAVQSAGLLPDPNDCTAPGGRSARGPLPIDPGVRREVGELRRTLAEVRALIDVGHLVEARRVMDAVAGRIELLGYLPLIADARLVNVALQYNDWPKGVLALDAALWAAEASGDDLIAARALIGLVQTAGYHLGRLEDARQYARRADAVLRRMGDPVALRNELMLANANALFKAGRDDEATPIAERVAAYYRQTTTARPDLRVFAQLRLGALLRRRGQFHAALAAYLEARPIADAEFGPDHPSQGGLLNNLGWLYVTMGELDRAEPLLRESQRMLGDYYSADSPHRGLPLINLGLLLRYRARLSEALTAFELAWRLQSPQDPSRPLTQARIGGTWCLVGEPARGATQVEAALALLPATEPAQQADRGQALGELAACQERLGARRRARGTAEAAVATLASAGDREALARARVALAERCLGAEPQRAQELVRQLAAMRRSADLPADVVARLAAVTEILAGATRP
jgi:eukaryotic-like serine/threonine-protein kinase